VDFRFSGMTRRREIAMAIPPERVMLQAPLFGRHVWINRRF
jgi:hypothetical protein